MKITTNHQFRPVLLWTDLTMKELEEFDYISTENLDYATFFRYKGQVYDLDEFLCITQVMQVQFPEFKSWDGYQADTFFSGILVRYSEDLEQVVVGSYYC